MRFCFLKKHFNVVTKLPLSQCSDTVLYSCTCVRTSTHPKDGSYGGTASASTFSSKDGRGVPLEREGFTSPPARPAGQTGAHATGPRARDARRRRQPVRGVGAPRSRRHINRRVTRRRIARLVSSSLVPSCPSGQFCVFVFVRWD